MQKLIQKAIKVRHLYQQLEEKRYGRSWTPAEIAQGFVGDVGDLQKLVMAKSGIRDIDDVDQKLAHELADCLWSIIILANDYHIDLESAFNKTMADIEQKIKNSSQSA